MAGHQTGSCLVCPECGKTFSRVASLRCHLAVHQEEDNLVCDDCGEEFVTEVQLQTHKTNCHSDKSNSWIGI